MLIIDLEKEAEVSPDGSFVMTSYNPEATYTSDQGVMSVFKKIDVDEYVFSAIVLDPTYLDTKDYICVWSK